MMIRRRPLADCELLHLNPRRQSALQNRPSLGEKTAQPTLRHCQLEPLLESRPISAASRPASRAFILPGPINEKAPSNTCGARKLNDIDTH